MNKKELNINYNGWELKFFDKSKNFRNYQLKLIKNYIKGHVAEVGPGNGTNLSYYVKYPKKKFKKIIKFPHIIKNLLLKKINIIQYYI